MPRHTPSCPHGRYRTSCFDCKSRGVCIHHKRRTQCMNCVDTVHLPDRARCPHGKQRYYCHECGGIGVKLQFKIKCIHDKYPRYCNECDSPQCKHGIKTHLCKSCRRYNCPHGGRPDICVECSPVCSHGIKKKLCKLCKHTRCEHHKRKDCCTLCSKRSCEGCMLFLVANKNPDGQRLCDFCNPYSKRAGIFNENRAEVQVAQEIARRLDFEHYHVHPIYTYSPYRECNDANRPDILIDAPKFKVRVVLECDEHSHSRKEYTPSCEFAKILNHAQSTCATDGFEHVLAIRINPNVFRDKKGKIVAVSFGERMDALQKIIERIPDMIWPEGSMQMKMVYLFYKNKDAEEWVEEAELKEWFTKLQEQPQGIIQQEDDATVSLISQE